MLLITNNKKFIEIKEDLLAKGIKVEFLDEDYIGVLQHVRDLIHGGYELLTHPLYGSVKPNETIYRTIILKEGSKLDFNSLGLIEDAIQTAEKFKKNKLTPNQTERVKDDFRVIDYDLMSKTVRRIINEQALTLKNIQIDINNTLIYKKLLDYLIKSNFSEKNLVNQLTL